MIGPLNFIETLNQNFHATQHNSIIILYLITDSLYTILLCT